MKESEKREIRRLEDVLAAIHDISVVREVKNRDFLALKAMERCFEILGETCRRISPELREKYPEIPWKNIIALRNLITHEYEKIEMDTLWDIAEHKIPALKDWIVGIIEKEGGENGASFQ
jgi:uncharacterized protein with HEPN domain